MAFLAFDISRVQLHGAVQRSRLLSRPTRRMRDVIISVMPPQLTRESALESSCGDSRLYCQAALESDSPRYASPLPLSLVRF